MRGFAGREKLTSNPPETENFKDKLEVSELRGTMLLALNPVRLLFRPSIVEGGRFVCCRDYSDRLFLGTSRSGVSEFM